MRRIAFYGFTILTACMIAGCMFDSDDKDDAKKGSVSGKVTMMVTGTPVAGVKVMLYDAKAKLDSTDYSLNWKSFVDSTTTGSDGGYVIDGIAPGEYGVVPVNADTSVVYAFSLAGSGDYRFTMNGDTHTVDFIAEKKDFPGANVEYITDSIGLDTSDLVSIVSIYKARRMWVGPIPFYQGTDTDTHNKSQIYCKYEAGYTAVLWTMDNCYLYETTYIDKSNREKKAILVIYHPLDCERTTYYYYYNPATGSLKEMSGY